ncbi:uncharacterized protein PG986_007414 [Apiospora aurea]|uniref:Life-span regulatory factor domain-containing protein n=1 Tax=Apiospora aurea TaxID=335848 RepID=A0ABR1QCH3_9PEZI
MHHTRRKSGHGSTNTSMSDVRKAVTVSDLSRPRRPQTLSRKSTPQTLQKLGKTQRDREKELQEERWWEEERESFPQFCMTCEKQFIPQDERYVYCSEACRKYDQSSSSNPSAYPIPRTQDILGGICRFMQPGTRSRATSSRELRHHARAQPTSHHLRRLLARNIRLPYQHCGLSPLARQVHLHQQRPVQACGRLRGDAAVSPSTSYSKPNNFYSSTYDGGYGMPGYGYRLSSGGAGGLDRPLPSRKPGTKGRPKSIELVTPMVGR